MGEPPEMKGRKRTLAVLGIIVLIILLGFIGYKYVIPRLDLEVKVVYRESQLANINLTVIISNEGNTDVDDIWVRVNMDDENGRTMGEMNRTYPGLSSDSSRDFGRNLVGDQGLDHIINVSISFEHDGKRFYKDWSFEENEEIMLLAFEERISDWFP